MLSLRRFGGWLKEHKSTFLTPLAIGAATATAISVSLYMLQDSLIYLSRRYGSADENAVAAFNGQMEKIGRPPVEPLSFTVPSVGAQRSFWIPPATSVPCASTSSSSSGIGEKETRGRVSVWILQGGNAMVALDWLAFLPYLLQRPSIEVQDEVPKEATGFLLVDYPSYGDCEGTPSPATCGETAETALLTLLEGLKEGNGSLGGVSEVELNFFGHSIGSASVLQLAVNLLEEAASDSSGKEKGTPTTGTVEARVLSEAEEGKREGTLRVRPGRVVLVSPFSSMVDMVGTLLPFIPRPLARRLLKHRWDNEESMRRLGASLKVVGNAPVLELEKGRAELTQARSEETSSSSSPSPLSVSILHGTADEIVPFRQGKQVFETAQKALEGTGVAVKFDELPGGDHNSCIARFIDKVVGAMFGLPSSASFASASSERPAESSL